MNFAVILSGGVGIRMRIDGLPKQYLEVRGKPIIAYTLEKFQANQDTQKIIIVAASEWQEKLFGWIKQYRITKFVSFALPGDTRQESILNGLEECAKCVIDEKDKVVIHDGVRPLLSDSLITKCFTELEKYDGCMPILPINDTVYQSTDGKEISRLLDRNTIFAGQSPESFRLKKYLKINRNAEKDILSQIKGSTEIAYNNGFRIRLIQGEDMNFKLTTPADLQRFETIICGEKK